MSDDKKTKRKAQGSPQKDPAKGSGDRDIGHALRSVYSKTVGEDVPSEFMDLLSKLS